MEGGNDIRRSIGQLGEDIACRFLMESGHTILERNWRSGHLEVDIISFDVDGIHFVEVKARRENIQAPPQENVRWQKQKNIAKAAQAFLRSGKGHPYGSHECFFDIVAVTFTRNGHSIEWIPQAYITMYK